MKFKIFLSIIFTVFCLVILNINANSEQQYIIIDPGHGGMDPGCNIENFKESDIVLDISYKIKEILEAFGYNVILTRKTKEALCEGKFVKRIDTEKRINIINSYNVLMVLSIHLNEFSIEKYRGAQVFYNNNNKNNKMLAESVQQAFRLYLNNTDRLIKYKEHNMLLNRLSVPACIIECGFISNKQEFRLLLSEEYQYKLAMSILYGVNSFLTILS